jgi:hypothetical protein
MPGSIRKPLAHPARAQSITKIAIELFLKMKRIRCTCERDDRGYRPRDCAGCKRWNELDELLRSELKSGPHEWPTIESPFVAVHPTCKPDERGRKLWLALEAGARELRRKERAARRVARQSSTPPSPSEPASSLP